MTLFPEAGARAPVLRRRLNDPELLVIPGCFDAFSAKLVERAGFGAAFMGGFCVAASRLGLPDAGLISYAEMLDQGRDVCGAVGIPVIGDADTGYGNALNVERSLRGYAQAGFACVMFEDQVWPKRCGHTPGKQTVDRAEAVARVRAAVEARARAELDILILARTDAVATEGLDEALRRAEQFAELGADITFVEAVRTPEDMRRYCESIPGPKLANLVEDGDTPLLSHDELREIGYACAIYPVSLLLAAQAGMERSLAALAGQGDAPARASFLDLQDRVGFPEYRERAGDGTS